MKSNFVVLMLAFAQFGLTGAQAEQTVLTADPTLAIPKVEFDTYDENSKILSGTADIDTYSTTEMPGMEGKHFEGLTLRLFNPKTRRWSLYWVASNIGVLDPPVVGSFENGVGHFLAKDTFKGKPIIMMFRWDARNKDRPVWSQAFSPDNGKTWEWNWFNVSERIK